MISHSTQLASRRYIEVRDLHGLQGAEQIIDTIRSRPSVTRLILGHNTLGDSGCTRLFDFLGSSDGLGYGISEISLNKNGIGNEGLWAINRFLQGSTRLKMLFLQYNRFEPGPELSRAFAESVNHSQLTILSLSTNSGFSDQFLEIFLPSLDPSTLRELHISACNLTPASGGYISSFLGSPGCRLCTFKCNGNELGLQAVQDILDAIENRNWTITTLELLSNGNITDIDPNNPGMNLPKAWKDVESKVKHLTTRNGVMQRKTQSQALQLLLYSRPLLLASKHTGASLALPMEIILHVLSFIAPTLSEMQRLRVVQYASDIKTLPPLLPALALWSPRTGVYCTPDPSKMGFSSMGQGCQDGKCMGPLNRTNCRLQEERHRWLDHVGCSFYEAG